MNTAAAGTLGLIVVLVIAAASIGYLVCFIQVLIPLFKKEGVGLGILGILCGLYPYVWGWIKSAELGLKKIMVWWTACIVVLAGMTAVIMAGMVGIASNPMFKKALARELRAQQDSYDRLSMMKSMNNVKQLCLGCISWADDHQGSFPAELDDLFTVKYLGTDKSQVIFCPLLRDDSRPGYLYQGRGVSASASGSTPVIVSVWSDGQGRHIVGHKDGSASLEIVKQRQATRQAASESTPAKTASQPAAGAPADKAPAMPPPSSQTSTLPEIPLITLSADERPGRLIHRILFPEEQMPANTDNYFWVVEFPNHEVKVKPLRPKAAFWLAPPKTSGTFKVSIEYRAGGLRRPASNPVDLIVP